MKTSLLLLSMLAFACFNSMAQCIGTLEPNVVVVDSSQTINGGFDPFWVCSGDTIHTDGGFHNIYLESGAVMTSGGGIDTIYVKAGASFYMNGGIHFIYFVNPSDVYVAGGIPTYNTCVTLNFDYTLAPINGCFVPPVAGAQSGDSAFCPGTCINFTDLSINATSWLWTFDGADTPNSILQNPQNICYSNSGTFDVTLIAFNSSGSDTVELDSFITVFAVANPLITQNDDTLFTSQNYATWQWYQDTTAISGANSYYYVVPQNGDYSVEVTDSNGCGSSASIDSVDISTGIASVNYQEISVYPNPAGETIIITDNQRETLQFFDLLGRNLYTIRTSPSGKTWVDISTFPSIFFIRTEGTEVIKVIRQ